MRTRLFYIDISKIIAICCVVICHVWGRTHNGFVSPMDSQLSHIAIIIGTMGVPLFVMTTGVLIFNKKFECRNDIIYFYRHNLLTLYITGAIWFIIYLIISDTPITFHSLYRTLFLLEKPSDHLWYIRMILIYYMMLPFIVYINQKYRRAFFLLFLIALTITFLYNGYDCLFRNNPVPTQSGLSLISYLAYMALGNWISRKKISVVMVGFALISFCLGFCALEWSIMIGKLKFIWYDNPFVLCMTVPLFIIIRFLFINHVSRKFTESISNMTFGVYLCHMVILDRINSVFPPTLIGQILLLITTLTISFMVVKSTTLSKPLAKVIFRM